MKEKRIIRTVIGGQNRDSIGSIIERNAPDVRWVNYDWQYLGGCYWRFCRRPNAKHIRLVTCSSLMGRGPTLSRAV